MRRYRSMKERESYGFKQYLGFEPPEVGTFPLMSEVDIKSGLDRASFLDRTSTQVSLFLKVHGSVPDCWVWSQSNRGPEACWILRDISSHAYATVEECAKARRDIAIHIGLSPAAFHGFLPEYDSDFVEKFRYRYFVECRHGTLKCVRPDHLVLRRALTFEVKYPLMERTNVRERFTPKNPLDASIKK